MIKRPTLNETEDNLIEQEAEFMATHPLSSTKSTESIDKKIPTNPVHPTLKSKSKESVFASRTSNRSPITDMKDSINMVLKDVNENRNPSKSLPFSKPSGSGFPTVFHRSVKDFSLKSNQKFIIENNNSNPENSTIPKPDLNNENITTIDDENTQILNSMTEQEKNEAYQEIVSKLDPSLVKFLKSRKENKSSTSNINQTKTTSKINEIHSKVDINELETKNKVNQIQDNDINTNQVGNINDKSDGDIIIPIEKLETEKLEWMRNDSKKAPPTINQPEHILQQMINKIRFNFNGEEIDQSKTFPTHLGLHHHDDQDFAGYNITELLQLSRSNVSGQRSFATTVLTNIIKNIKQETRISKENIKLLEYFVNRLSVCLCFRICLDDQNLSVQIAGLNGLITFFSSSINDNNQTFKEESIYEKMAMLSDRSFSLNRMNILHMKSKSNDITFKDEFIFQSKEMGSYSLDEIRNILDFEPVLGLYASNIITRLVVLLNEENHEFDYYRSILYLLNLFARHSLFICDSIVRQPGFINLLIERFLSINLPFDFNDSSFESAQLSLLACKFLCLAAHQTLEICKFISDMNIVAVCSKFITLSKNDFKEECRPLYLQLKAETMKLFSTLILYGTDSYLFGDFRQLVTINLQQSLYGDYEFLFFQIHFLNTVLTYHPDEMNIGMNDDAFRIFIKILLDSSATTLKKPSCDSFIYEMCIKESLNLISSYINLLPDPSSFYQHMKNNPIIDTFDSILKDLYSQVESLTKPRLDNDYHFGLWYTTRISHANDILSLSSKMCCLASTLNVFISFISKSKNPQIYIIRLEYYINQINPFLLKLFRNPIINSLKGDLLNLCLLGLSDLINRWFQGSLLLKSINQQFDSTLLYKISHLSISYLYPGDEILVKQIYDTIFESKGIKSISNISIGPNTESALIHIKEICSLNTFEESSLARSQEIHKLRKPLQMCIDFDGWVGLPVNEDWMLYPINMLYDESKLSKNPSGMRSIIHADETETDSTVLDIIELLLKIISESFLIISAKRMFHIMHIYLWPTLVYKNTFELFLCPEIKPPLSLIFKKFIETGEYMNLERDSGGSAKFYRFYGELINQYCSNSYGDSLFGIFLLIPLRSCFPKDYAMLFWNEAIDYLRGFKHGVDVDLEVYKQNAPELVLLYKYAIENGKITEQDNPLLYAIATYNINLKINK